MSYFYLSLFLVNLRSKIFQYPGTLKAYIYGMHQNGLQYSTWSHSLLMNNKHLMTGLRRNSEFCFPRDPQCSLSKADFSWSTPEFYDFPGLENEIINFYHDFPGLPYKPTKLGCFLHLAPSKLGREIKGQNRGVGRGKKGTLPHPYPLLLFLLLPHSLSSLNCSCPNFCAALMHYLST